MVPPDNPLQRSVTHKCWRVDAPAFGVFVRPHTMAASGRMQPVARCSIGNL